MPDNVRDLYEKGVAALQKNNLDYAVALFGQATRIEPSFLDARQALRAAQHRRVTGKGGGLFKRFLGSASSLTKGQLALRANPAEAIRIAEDCLNDDPSNEAAHVLLAEAAMALDLPKTAALSLEIAFKNNPRDRKLALRLANALSHSGQRSRAEKVYRDLLQADPHDPEVGERLKNLLATQTLTEGGYETLASGKGTFRDALRDETEALRLEQEGRVVKDTDVLASLIANREARLERDPANIQLWREVADLHLKRQDPDRAIAALRKVLELGGTSDPVLQRAIHEAELTRFDQQLAALDPQAPDAADRREALLRERSEFVLADVQRRAEANPTDLQVRFELGDLYLENGRIPEAIAEFQRAQNHPNRRIAALGRLARCFLARKMPDLAVRKIEEALKEKLVFDEEKKDLHYQLGVALESVGRHAEAMEHFKLIYESDIGYRDVAARVDSHYASES